VADSFPAPGPAPVYRVVGTTTAGDEIRKFADANIAGAIDRALPSLPAGRRIAVVAAANMTGATGAVMVRLGDEWSFVTTVSKPWRGSLGAEAAVRWSR